MPVEPPPAPVSSAAPAGPSRRVRRSSRARPVRRRRRSLGFLIGGLLLGALATGMATLAPVSADAAGMTEVDLELVLAVDVSFSMDLSEQRLQRDGYVAALRSPEVAGAIAQGMLGRIAVLYPEWGGATDQAVVVDWTVLSDAASITAFADTLAAAPIRRVYRTSISGALLKAHALLEDNAIRGLRRVVDVSGDGPNNQGRPVLEARAEALADGITINGLPLMLSRPTATPFDIADLDAYYRRCVVGGPGAFLVPVRDRSDFPTAIRRKMVMEIAGRVPPGPPRIEHAAAEDDSEACTIGERLWRKRFFSIE